MITDRSTKLKRHNLSGAAALVISFELVIHQDIQRQYKPKHFGIEVYVPREFRLQEEVTNDYLTNILFQKEIKFMYDTDHELDTVIELSSSGRIDLVDCELNYVPVEMYKQIPYHIRD